VHLDGRKVPIEASSVTKPGEVIVVPNEGMPIRGQPSKRGNLYVTIAIEFPTFVVSEQKEGCSSLSQVLNNLQGLPNSSNTWNTRSRTVSFGTPKFSADCATSSLSLSASCREACTI
jgi:DnaJ-class molecular chaperone